jgi:hypothetical protein
LCETPLDSIKIEVKNNLNFPLQCIQSNKKLLSGRTLKVMQRSYTANSAEAYSLSNFSKVFVQTILLGKNITLNNIYIAYIPVYHCEINQYFLNISLNIISMLLTLNCFKQIDCMTP